MPQVDNHLWEAAEQAPGFCLPKAAYRSQIFAVLVTVFNVLIAYFGETTVYNLLIY
jgi:hypothetical protein